MTNFPNPPGHDNMQEWYERLKGERLARVDRKRKRGGLLFLLLAALVLPAILVGARSWIGYSVGEGDSPQRSDPAVIAEAPLPFTTEQADDVTRLYLLAWLALNLKDDPLRMQTFTDVVIPAVQRNYGCLPADGVGPYQVKPSETRRHNRLMDRAFLSWRRQGLIPGHASEGRWHATLVWRCT